MAARPRVVVTHLVHDEVLERLAQRCDVVANQTRATLRPPEILARCRDADALLAFMPDTVDRAFIDACPRLRVVAGALRGYDNIDVAACRERGIVVTIVPELLAGPTAELGVGLLIALARRIPEGDAFVRSGRFAGWRSELFAPGIAGRTVGQFGMGQLGRAFARRLGGFDATLLYDDVRALTVSEERSLALERVTFGELLERSDHLVITVPLDPSTLHRIDAAALARMRRGATLINLSRGSVVDEAAVADALGAGHLGGYGADVYELEDRARSQRPATIAAALLAATDRTVLTPHLGSAVGEVRRAIEMSAAESALAVLRGERPETALP